MASTTRILRACRDWWGRTLAHRVYATLRSVLMDRHTDKIVLLICCLMLYYAWRLAVVAGWVHVTHGASSPPAAAASAMPDAGIAEASARLSAAAQDFWGSVIPPGLTSVVLALAALCGLGALYTRNAGLKIGVMLVGVAFYLRSGGMLCWYSPDHLGGIPWLIQAGACAATARALVDVYVHDILDLEQLLTLAVQAGSRPDWAAVPWLVRRRLRRRAATAANAGERVAAASLIPSSGLRSASKR